MRKILFIIAGLAALIWVTGFGYGFLFPEAAKETIANLEVKQAEAATSEPSVPAAQKPPEKTEAAKTETKSADPISNADLMPDRVLGKKDAPVTIIEYASLTCPHCAHFHNDVLPKIKSEYIDKGLVKLILRPFPFDAIALKGSVIAYCLDEAQYYPFIGAVYSSQEKWARSPDPEAELKKIARLAGLSEGKMTACLDAANSTGPTILRGRAEGEKTYGVTSTPSFIIGSEKIEGARNFETFDNAIKQQLKAAGH